MALFFRCLAMLFAGAFGAALVYLGIESAPSVGLLLAAIVLGGVGGGFTLGLIGGERYGLKIPGKVGVDHKFDPGFLGDVFVGLMSSFLGIGAASRTLRTDLFAVDASSLTELWFLNFAIAYICGFLGLRLVKGLSERFLQESEIKEGLQRVEQNEGVTAFLSGQTAISMGQIDEAEGQFRKALCLDKGNEVRALIGLGRVQKRKGQLADAIATLSDAIDMRDKEEIKGRIAVAYWNRACYRALLSSSPSQPDREQIFHDLMEAIRIQPAYRHDLTSEVDLKGLQDDANLISLSQ